MTPPAWCVLQIGAREHYAIARALHLRGQLQQLLTDCWVPPGSTLTRLPGSQRLAGRFHPELATASVRSRRFANLPFELGSRLAGPAPGWPRTLARNQEFSHWTRRQLQPLWQARLALFSYSYAALSAFELAAERGWRRVLGQIDPGPCEERIVLAEHRRYPQISSSWQPAPPAYWQSWERELALADRIVVNSPWSQNCLREHGVAQSKLSVVPLVFNPAPAALAPQPAPHPTSPASSSGCFQLLFLGTICLRKGIGRLLDAMQCLQQEPVRLTLAGPTELDPQAWANRANIHWIGPVTRSQVHSIYQQAHAMILPTLSDGFALTQLEALAVGCPLIASPFCGQAVTTGVNGWILPSLEPEAIADTIRLAMDTAGALPRPLAAPPFGLDDLADQLVQLVEAR